MEYKAITYQDIAEACTGLKTTNIKGKEYVQVNERVNAFRKVNPEGYIDTDIISDKDGVVLMKAEVGRYVFVDGAPVKMVLGTGYAYEVQTASYINKTSYIENCQTSAIGRALGFAGYGLDVAIASAEEMVNAVEQQAHQATISEQEAVLLEASLRNANVDIPTLLKQKHVKRLEDLNSDQYAEIWKALQEWSDLKKTAQP